MSGTSSVPEGSPPVADVDPSSLVSSSSPSSAGGSSAGSSSAGGSSAGGSSAGGSSAGGSSAGASSAIKTVKEFMSFIQRKYGSFSSIWREAKENFEFMLIHAIQKH